jgi:hypothetical protein
MTEQGREKIESFKLEIQDKIQRLLSEFADGTLNREQFNAIYQHYSAQLAFADQSLQTGDKGDVPGRAGQTIHIRQAHMGKAVGLIIYHNKRGTLLDTLGDFDVPVSVTSADLNDITEMMQINQYIERRVKRVAANQWLLFAAGRYSTVVTLFQHEPSQRQISEIERLHHDFEVANDAFLSKGRGDANTLAYPFLVFVQQKLTRERRV